MNGILNESKIVEKYEFDKPEIDEVDYLLTKVIEYCKKKSFHILKYRCVYDIKFTNITNIANVFLNISHDCLEFKSEYYG